MDLYDDVIAPPAAGEDLATAPAPAAVAAATATTPTHPVGAPNGITPKTGPRERHQLYVGNLTWVWTLILHVIDS